MIDLDQAMPAPAWLEERAPRRCILCGWPAAVIGVWVEPGCRPIAYGLCGPHAELADDFRSDIEAAILRATGHRA